MNRKPIFFDSKGRRARLTNGLLTVSGFVGVCGLATIGFGVLVAPSLPRLSAPPIESRIVPDVPSSSLTERAEVRISPARTRQIPEQALQTKRLAFFDDDTDAPNIPALKRHAAELDGIIPEWLAFAVSETTGQPELRTGSAPSLMADGTRHVRSVEVTQWVRQNAPHLEIYPQLTSSLTKTETAMLLAEPSGRFQLLEELTAYLRQNHFHGVTVSLPDPGNGHRDMVVFLNELKERLQGEGRKLIVEVSGYDLNGRMQAMTQAADYVLVNLHKWHQGEAFERSSRAGAGPLASQGWFEDRLWAHVAKIPPGKLIIGVGSFGYDWDQHGVMHPISVPAAWDLMERFGASVQFDTRSLNPTFRYVDRAGIRHEVWFLDGVTAFNQVRAALASQPAGIAIWRLGLEDPGVWAFAGRNRIPDGKALESLQTLQPGYDLFAQARGVLLSASPGSTGVRTVSFNDSIDLIVGQTVARPPHQAQLTAWYPVDPKAIAITFDDGPDPVWSPKILDVLAQKGVKATFYVLGRNALSHSDILQRMYAEGHDIGGHSFSHENLFQASDQRIALEFNAVQRLFEAQLGVNSILLRAPYAFGPGFQYLDAAPNLVAAASRLGYLHANLDVDGYDWAFTDPKRIARQVVTEVTEGRGQIVLLHDAGGNRRATVEALPDIIDQLQAKGFRFVATHELAGKPRAEVMPPVAWALAVERAQSTFGLAYVRSMAWLGEVIPVVAISTAALGMLRLGLIVLGAFIQKRRSQRRKSTFWQPEAGVAVLVPAYNEETVICKTVDTLLNSTLKADIFVIDDGSSDRTSDIVRETYAGDERVKVFRKENGGKSAALNFGITQTEGYEVIVAIDGDTMLMPDAIERLVEPFQTPRVGAVAGKVVVGNTVNLMTRFQALEYLMSQNLDRRAFELLNAIGVVPGAIGAWRRRALVEAGGYSHDTLAEDADLTIAIERRGWTVLAEPAAVALTEAPESLRSFMKQRFRWMFGTLQVAYKHAGGLFGRPSGVWIIVPNVLVFQFAFTLLAPIMDLLLVWTIAVNIRSLVMYGWVQANTPMTLAGYWAFFQTIDVAAAAAAVALDGQRPSWRLFPLLAVQRFTYRQLLYWVAIRTLLAAIKGSFVGWGKLIRTGSVSLPPQTKTVG